ncbi:MAG: hypothetical protein HWN80_19275 [Candidatus Lokiarchaeota archaeon]|nr:hypothetical protein [Candidatus Lokiarchaeota archaeon]
MTEELLKIFDQNRKTPLEDRMNRTINSFENMFSLFLEVTEIIDNKLNSLQDQIDSLETRFNTLEKSITKKQLTTITSVPAPAPTIKKENTDNPSRAVLNELRDLFEKNKKNKEEE